MRLGSALSYARSSGRARSILRGQQILLACLPAPLPRMISKIRLKLIFCLFHTHIRCSTTYPKQRRSLGMSFFRRSVPVPVIAFKFLLSEKL